MQIEDPDGVKNIAFVTAHEPPGKGTNFQWDNDEMQFHLKSMLKRRGYTEFYPIIGKLWCWKIKSFHGLFRLYCKFF